MFLANGIIALFALIPLLGRAHLEPGALAVGLTCVIGGHALGSRAFARLEASRFEPLLLAVIVCAGMASIVGGVSAL